MEDSVSASGALGARFKAGLLNGLGKLSPTKSVEQAATKTTVTPSSKKHTKGVGSKRKMDEDQEIDASAADALLDDGDNDEDILLDGNDDALLEGDGPDKYFDEEPTFKKARTNSLSITVTNGNTSTITENGEEDNKLRNGLSDPISRVEKALENNKKKTSKHVAEVKTRASGRMASSPGYSRHNKRMQLEISKTDNSSNSISVPERVNQSTENSAKERESHDRSLKKLDNSDLNRQQKEDVAKLANTVPNACDQISSSGLCSETNANSPEATEVEVCGLADEELATETSNSLDAIHTDSALVGKSKSTKIGRGISVDSSNKSEVQMTLEELVDQAVFNADVEVEDGASCRPPLASGASNNEMASEKSKLSPTEEEHGGRLNKLISHLSTTLDEEGSKTPSQDDMEDDLEYFQLTKNGLASFYDAIIKGDVIKDSCHEELAKKHQELQIKNNMDCKKIQKILHEVKTVREKLKCMNIRPGQRSVSTQICAEKLQVPLDQPGNKILKSTVLSLKALTEQHKFEQQMKKQRIEQQVNVKPQEADMAAKRRFEEHAWAMAAKAKEEIKKTPEAKAVSKAAPSNPAVGKDNEVIDLTADDDSSKAAVIIPTDKSLNMFKTVTASVPRAMHPAPLPSIPLTGTSGHLLKPNAPRLELSCKDDGIVLQWTMNLSKNHAKITTYQIFGYKERQGPLTGNEWKKVGDLKALALPMACTLTQFQTGHRYHFAVRAVDDLGRTGSFSLPRSTKLG